MDRLVQLDPLGRPELLVQLELLAQHQIPEQLDRQGRLVQSVQQVLKVPLDPLDRQGRLVQPGIPAQPDQPVLKAPLDPLDPQGRLVQSVQLVPKAQLVLLVQLGIPEKSDRQGRMVILVQPDRLGTLDPLVLLV